MRYGGNTTCLEIRTGSDIIILDAGTGLRALGKALLAEYGHRPLQLNLLISHTHWDHIQGFPFFAPVYEPRCRLTIMGCANSRPSLEAAFAGQMETTYFPVEFEKLASQIDIQELPERDFAIGSTLVRAHRANHPGLCAGFRLQTPAGTICFFPDTEPNAGGDDRPLLDFIRAADVLILDSQYDHAEFKKRAGWGHGCVDKSVALALEAGVKKLILFHHDPDHDDKKIDLLLRHAKQIVIKKKGALRVEAAREGLVIRLSGKKRVK